MSHTTKIPTSRTTGTPDLRQVILDFAPYLHIAHQIAGRIRFKVDTAILDSAILKKYGADDLGDALGSVRGVKQIKTNLLARSCVVEYDSRIIPDTAWHDLLGVVSEFGKNRTLSERLATRDAIVKHFVIYGILLKLA